MISSILLHDLPHVFLFIYLFGSPSLMYCWNYIAMDEKMDEKFAH
jgi:hypothetical protein